jgi:excinuclease ABC subunit C
MINLEKIPSKPGCYLFKDTSNTIIYIGKAKELKKRVSSYFQKTEHDPKTKLLIENISDIDFIITANEVEALILENNLIKKHSPKYNINLKDAKRYAYLELTDEEFPRLLICRKREAKGKYFGPFVSAETRDYIMEMLIKTFQLRACSKLPKRACLRYHISLCQAPCIKNITEQQYQEQIALVSQILSGKTDSIISELTTRMNNASLTKNFERALQFRNQIQALTRLTEKQNMERSKTYDEDIINFFIKDNKVYLMLFNISKGILENKQEFEFDYYRDFLEDFMAQYYTENKIPREIILPREITDALAAYLEQQSKTPIRITVPQKGEKKELLMFVENNIKAAFFGNTEKLEDLQEKLRLSSLPLVIECFDISHLSGTAMVASMVQFRNAKPDKSNYRRFKIESVVGIDDFKGIAEVVRRRYTRILHEMTPQPDLIIIDGGKGQLNAALQELQALSIKIPIISIAKKFEEVYVPGLSRPLNIDKKSKALQLIRQIRDEAHRFALAYNRIRRRKELYEL